MFSLWSRNRDKPPISGNPHMGVKIRYFGIFPHSALTSTEPPPLFCLFVYFMFLATL